MRRKKCGRKKQHRQLSGSDKIPVKIDTITADINDTYLKNINNGLSNNSFLTP